MGIIREPLQRVAVWARSVGAIAVAIGGVVVIIWAVVAFGRARDGVPIPALTVPIIALAASAVPGALLMFFSRKLDDGAHWAFYPIAALAIPMAIEARAASGWCRSRRSSSLAFA